MAMGSQACTSTKTGRRDRVPFFIYCKYNYNTALRNARNYYTAQQRCTCIQRVCQVQYSILEMTLGYHRKNHCGMSKQANTVRPLGAFGVIVT